MKVPTNVSELNQAASLPFNEAMGIISRVDKALVQTWGEGLYGAKFGRGYLHSSDHYAALKILLEREPTFAEVYRSYHAGSRNIDAAREKSGGTGRPEGWGSWTQEQRLYAVLTQRYGISQGSKIFDGKANDPDPKATVALLAEWSGGAVPVEPPAPPVQPKPVDPKLAPPIAPPTDLAGQLQAMESRLNGRLDQILARLPRI